MSNRSEYVKGLALFAMTESPTEPHALPSSEYPFATFGKPVLEGIKKFRQNRGRNT